MPERHAAPRLVHGIDGLDPSFGRLLVVVGAFDGLHRGHVYLLRRLREASARLGARPTVLTFDHHPDEIVRGAAPPVLCDPDERLVRFGDAGVAVTVVQHFDAALRATPYEAFVDRIRERVDLAGFLMTPDAAFGKDRQGTPETLARLGKREGFAVVVVPPFRVDGRQVRSNAIRGLIAEGDLREAGRLLGRRVAVVGDPGDPGEPGDTTATDAPRALRTVPVTFPMPVALPPAGTYGVRLERAWTPATADVRGEGRGATALVAGGAAGGIDLRARGELPGPGRVRIAFLPSRA